MAGRGNVEAYNIILTIYMKDPCGVVGSRCGPEFYQWLDKAVEDDIRKAHEPQAKFTRLESKEDIMSMINAL